MLILRGHEAPVRCVAYAPDSRRLASGGEDGTARVWDLPAGDAARTLTTREDGVLRAARSGLSVEAVAFSPDGATLVGGAAPAGLLVWWDLQTGGQVATASGHHGGVRCLSYARDGTLLASGGWDQAVNLWQQRGRRWASVNLARDEAVTALTFLPGTEVLAIGGVKGTVALHDVGQARPVAGWQVGQPVYSLAASPDGALLAAGDARGGVTLWDVRAHKQVAALQGHTWTVYGLAFSPGGSSLVSGGADGLVCQWDVAAGRLRQTFRWHARWVTCVAVAPDGMTAAAGSEDQTVVLWDLGEE